MSRPAKAESTKAKPRFAFCSPGDARLTGHFTENHTRTCGIEQAADGTNLVVIGSGACDQHLHTIAADLGVHLNLLRDYRSDREREALLQAPFMELGPRGAVKSYWAGSAKKARPVRHGEQMAFAVLRHQKAFSEDNQQLLQHVLRSMVGPLDKRRSDELYGFVSVIQRLIRYGYEYGQLEEFEAEKAKDAELYELFAADQDRSITKAMKRKRKKRKAAPRCRPGLISTSSKAVH